MAYSRRRSFSRRRFTKRNAERCIRSGSSVIAASTQQTAYTFTASEACTVKSIRLDCGVGGQSEPGAILGIPYVLTRVQEGYDANSLNYPALDDDLYNPTNEVLISGVLTDNAVEDHKSNFIGRKLKEGDRLCLIFLNTSTDLNVNVQFEMSFSILT